MQLKSLLEVCNTTYRPNYYIRNASQNDAQRVYYPGVPVVLEASETCYVESALVNLFRAQMFFAQ